MVMTKEEGRKFWTEWEFSQNFKAGSDADAFADALSKRLHAKLEASSDSQHCLTWSTSRPVPGLGREHSTRIVVVAAGTCPSDKLFSELRDLLGQAEVGVVFPLGEQEALLRKVRSSIQAMLVVDKQTAHELLWGTVDVAFLLHDAIRRNASDGLRARLNPYWTQGPVGGAMFFGRSEERLKLLADAGSGVAVIGPRGIGKSSLLLSVRDGCPDNSIPVYVNGEVHQRPEDISGYVMGKVFPQAKAAKTEYPLNDLPNRTARRIVLLIDEADPVIEYCDKSRRTDFYGELKWFAKNGGRLIMAGYRQFRQAIHRPTHELFQSMERLRLAPFSEGSEDASRLIVSPMSDRGLQYSNEAAAVARIMTWSSGHPLFIQLYCQRLMDLCLAQRSNQIDEQLLERTERDSQVYHNVMDTFNYMTDAMEKCAAYAALFCGNEFDQVELQDVLKKKWDFRPPVLRINNACEALVLANVLTEVEDSRGKYTFLFRALPSLMKAHNPIDRLMPRLVEDAKDEISP